MIHTSSASHSSPVSLRIWAALTSFWHWCLRWSIEVAVLTAVELQLLRDDCLLKPIMNDKPLEQLATLRAVVGYLGEKNQYDWWTSSFFVPNSHAFLAPVFARTPVLAQCMGVTRAAAVIHDKHIGVGRVYHLFRLPEDTEQAIHRALYEPDLCTRIAALTANRDAALAYLREIATSPVTLGTGPTSVGEAHALHDPRTWSLAASHFLYAFNYGVQVFPYLADRT